MRDTRLRWLALATIAAGALVVAGCSREESLACGEDARYLQSRTVPPLRVPDDLTVPDEIEALRIPDAPPPDRAPPEGECLETPPDFFGEQGAQG